MKSLFTDVRIVVQNQFWAAKPIATPLVSRISDTWHKSRSAAPGWQGARSEDIGHIRATSNAASRDAPPANDVANH